MSKNKGKDGEMAVVKLVADISIIEDGCDFTRQTTTNTADRGADLVLEHPDGYLQKLKMIADGQEVTPALNSTEKTPRTVKTRIDVKATNKKLQKETVIKFAGDIRKNPDCKGHVLMGGQALTTPAQEQFDIIQKTAAEDGTDVMYIPNQGVKVLRRHFSRQVALQESTDDEGESST